MKLIPASSVPVRVAAGDAAIVIRHEKTGRIVKELPIRKAVLNPRGCLHHVHVTLQSGPTWCYDRGALLEVS